MREQQKLIKYVLIFISNIKNDTHILHEMNSNFFGILCSKITGKAAMSNHISKTQLSCLLLRFSVPKTNGQYKELNGLFYTCDGFIQKEGFSLFIGHRDFNKKMARRATDHQNEYYNILKIVYNIYKEYLNFIF